MISQVAGQLHLRRHHPDTIVKLTVSVWNQTEFRSLVIKWFFFQYFFRPDILFTFNVVSTLHLITLHSGHSPYWHHEIKHFPSFCLKFAKSCLRLKNFEKLFPIHSSGHRMKTRHEAKYQVSQSNSKRLANSAIPQMLKSLNKEHKEQKQQENQE